MELEVWGLVLGRRWESSIETFGRRQRYVGQERGSNLEGTLNEGRVEDR